MDFPHYTIIYILNYNTMLILCHIYTTDGPLGGSWAPKCFFRTEEGWPRAKDQMRQQRREEEKGEQFRFHGMPGVDFSGIRFSPMPANRGPRGKCEGASDCFLGGRGSRARLRLGRGL